MGNTIDHLAAVRQNGLALEHVPKELLTPEMCLEAVRQNGNAIFHVPTRLLSPRLCLEAVRQTGWTLVHVPGTLRTPELCLEAVRQDGRALQLVLPAHMTPELCLAAVRQNGKALPHVPHALRTAELCRVAFEQNCESLQWMPEEHRTPEMCGVAVRSNPALILHVPQKLLVEAFSTFIDKSGQQMQERQQPAPGNVTGEDETELRHACLLVHGRAVGDDDDSLRQYVDVTVREAVKMFMIDQLGLNDATSSTQVFAESSTGRVGLDYMPESGDESVREYFYIHQVLDLPTVGDSLPFLHAFEPESDGGGLEPSRPRG